jgi:hypothetical protein
MMTMSEGQTVEAVRRGAQGERDRITLILDEMLAETVGPGTALMSAARVGARQALTEAKRRIEGGKESGDG